MNELHAQLDSLAAHVREPDKNAGPPGIEERRLKIYRDLVFNNLGSLLAGSFPVIRGILDDAEWHALIRAFLARHRSRTPLFPELAREFIAFLEIDAGRDAARPWLAELAHYEWAETGLQLSDATLPPHAPDGDVQAGVPMLSPLAWPLAYAWPVNRIAPGFQSSLPPPGPTLVLLRRDANGRVHFSLLSPLLYRLLELAGENHDRSGRELLLQLAREAGQHDFDPFLAEAAPMLQRLRDEGVLLVAA